MGAALGFAVGCLLVMGIATVTDDYASAGDVRWGWAFIGVAVAILAAIAALEVWARWWPVRGKS